MKGAPRDDGGSRGEREGRGIGAAYPPDFRERNSLVADANRGGNLLSLPRWRPSTSGGFSSRWQSTHFPARTHTRYMFVPSLYTSVNIEASVPLELALARKVQKGTDKRSAGLASDGEQESRLFRVERLGVASFK